MTKVQIQRRSARPWLLGLSLLALLVACRPAPPGPAQPKAQAPAKPADRAAPTQPPIPAASPEPAPASLHLSTLPADTMAVARIRATPDFQSALQTALDLPPASLARSLPIALRLPLSMLTLAVRPSFPFATRPMALVWDPKQRAIWIWRQEDLSLAGRQAIEQALGATTSFSPPYWIHQRPEDPLEYFVHTKARWLIACPKAFAPAIRSWLKDTRATKPGQLPWAPSPQDSPPLLVRWRYPQLLESAPSEPLGITGELSFSPQTGVLINGATRSTP